MKKIDNKIFGVKGASWINLGIIAIIGIAIGMISISIVQTNTVQANEMDDPMAMGIHNVDTQEMTVVSSMEITENSITNSEMMTSPSVTVIQPNGGEVWDVGSTYLINWTASGGFSVIINLYYSTDDGGSYSLIKSWESNDGSYNWVIPDDVSLNCLVKVVAIDFEANMGYDESDSSFEIRSPSLLWKSWYPNAKITSDQVTMSVSDGTESYFIINLTNVPMGHHVENGEYPGWCYQKNVTMPRGAKIPVRLCHSYDPNKPDAFKNTNWDEVNYVINTRENYPPAVVQQAVWGIIEGIEPTSTEAVELMQKAMSEGSGFTPTHGDCIAVLVYLDPILGYNESVQNTFIEVPLNYSACNATFWNDNRADWENLNPDTNISEIFAISGQLYGDLGEYNVSETIQGIPCTGMKSYYAHFLQEAIAALLNDYHDCIDYPVNHAQIIITVNNAWKTDFGAVYMMYRILWVYNHIGCVGGCCPCCP